MNRVCEVLGIEKPVIQAPMNWITCPELAAAVSNAGGLGILATGAGSPYKRANHEETKADFRGAIRRTKELTDKPFGILVLATASDRAGYRDDNIKIAAEEGVPAIVVVGNVFEDYDIKPLKEAGFTVIGRQLEPTIAGAKRLEELGADIVVATGCDEGGVMPVGSTGTMAMTALIADAVDVPVLAAGGIINETFARAAAIVGAEGAYVGTRFILTPECRASNETKQALLDTPQDDFLTITVRGGKGKWRSTPGRVVIEAYEANLRGDVSPNQGDYFASYMLGKLDEGVNAGSSAISLVKEIVPAADIVAEIARGFE